MRVVAFLLFVGTIPCAWSIAVAQDGAEPAPKKDARAYELRQRLEPGARYIGSNTIAFDLKTEVRRGKVTHETIESVEHTERFRDYVKTASERGPIEIERQYQKLFTKVRSSDSERPDVDQSPLQGQTVTIVESRRNRRVRTEGNVAIPALVRKSVGLEMDWRDILPRDPVKVGDVWEADAEMIARRIAVYFESGSRTNMRVTFEGIDTSEGARRAKFYVDWKIDGMRNRQLFTKIRLAGDVFFDLDMQRFTMIDLAGQFGIQGAKVQAGTAPEIIKSEGKVSYKSTLALAGVSAAAEK